MSAKQVDDWIETFTGKKFHFPLPNEDDICIKDIAHGLALTCRYGGQCRQFYSVAEHCVLLSRYKSSRIDRVNIRRELLMHDAQEAYLTDIPRPLKKCLPDYKKIENDIELIIYRIYGLSNYGHAYVKEYDNRILVTEARQLGLNVEDWCDYFKRLKPLDIKLQLWRPEVAEQMFLGRFKELFG